MKTLKKLSVLGVSAFVAVTLASCGGDDTSAENGAGQSYGKVSITTCSIADPKPGIETFYGKLTGVKFTSGINVGFEISHTSDFAHVRRVRTQTQTSDFSIDCNGILDQFTYYLRAYAEIEGKTLYGNVVSFTTPVLTYEIDGRKYEMVVVKGGPLGDFSMMQTEFPTDGEMKIGNMDLSGYLGQTIATKGLLRALLKYFREETGLHFRVPTIDEWQYAAMGGDQSKGYLYSGSNNIDDVAWYSGTCTRPHAPAEKKANELELYDMSGNMAEFCSASVDQYILDDNLDTAKFFDTCWANSYALGGHWKATPTNCRPSAIYRIEGPNQTNSFDGSCITFRFVYSRNPYHDCII